MRQIQMINAVLTVVFCISLLGCKDTVGRSVEQEKTTGSFTLYSDLLKEHRTCLVHLPETYFDKEQSRRYPVLILLDGNSHFNTVVAAIDSLRATDQTGVPEMIVIAIENTDRERDLTVTRIKTKRKNTMGGGRVFLDFIEQELLPYADERYRTLPQSIFVGHSLGGLLGMNAYMEGKRVFDSYICLDPSIWWDAEMMNKKVDATGMDAFRNKLYLASANQGEDREEKNKIRHQRLYGLLQAKSTRPEFMKWQYFEHEDHRSVPSAGIAEGLKFLFAEDHRQPSDAEFNSKVQNYDQ